MRRKSSVKSNPEGPPESGEAAPKLSFGGVATTLFQWKQHRSRAVKRRAQSIAIVSIHISYSQRVVIFEMGKANITSSSDVS